MTSIPLIDRSAIAEHVDTIPLDRMAELLASRMGFARSDAEIEAAHCGLIAGRALVLADAA